MKKTFPVNINGSIFYIDDDAYELLNNYLNQLKVAFPGSEGQEIVADIEGRIYEIFVETCGNDSHVINYTDVNTVIETMGKPNDISPDGDQTENQAFENGPTPPPYTESAGNGASGMHTSKRLFRDMQNKVLGGVLSGLAVYMNWNPTILRLLVVILAICTKIFPLFICYLIAWMVIPPANTMRRILEMRGEPVTVDSVSQSVLDRISAETASTTGPLGKIISVIFKIALVFISIVAICIGIGGLTLLFTTLCGLIVFSGWGSASLLEQMNLFEYSPTHPILYAFGVLATALAILVPCVAGIIGCVRGLKGGAKVSSATLITIGVVEVILIILAGVFLSVCSAYSDISLASSSMMTLSGVTLMTNAA